ncbi:carcinoembryonic antigen-related cell adhesion molecule 10-like isoform X2 [Rana temporaria]|nr:carcinoembryonic antigen-related cell adhesion molecule 10-like isoform X2 [Rana temporaria]
MLGGKEPTACRRLRLLTVLLGIFIASANGIETEVIPRNPSEGHPVLINIIGITEDIRFSEWYLGNNTSAENQIIRYNNGDGSQNKGAKYFTGANIYPNGSLEIQNFQKELESNYTVFIQGRANPYQQTVFLSVAMVSSNTIQVQRIPDSPRVNQTVLFNVTGISENIRFSEWYRGNDTSAANQIIRYNNNDNSKNLGAKHIESSSIFANGSLEIKNVTKDLEGDYTVFIQGAQTPFQSTVSLKVDVFLSVAMVSANTIEVQRIPDSPQVNQTVLFNVTGISETIRFSEWYRGNDTSAANQIIRYNNNDNSKNLGAKHIESSSIFANGSLEIKSVTKDLEGDYTVFIQGAQNPFQKTVSLKVSDPSTDRRGLSGGAIAGIVIGVLVAVTVAIVVGVYVFKPKDSG